MYFSHFKASGHMILLNIQKKLFQIDKLIRRINWYAYLWFLLKAKINVILSSIKSLKNNDTLKIM